ncbi:MAG: 2-iminoacetate synthase ThiH [Campylobacter sp.]|nr:2-iminoacetate synthase ThiH [Campylobacter sp.]
MVRNYEPRDFTSEQVRAALASKNPSPEHLQALLSVRAEGMIEELALRARELRLKYFGNAVNLFTPLYLSNHCNSKCTYCGFQKGNKIRRSKLNEAEIHAEMRAISQSGLQEIILLTGEGREHASPEYIAHACKIAREYFRVVGVEIYAMREEEYALLHAAGCDFVTIFQETYNPKAYKKFHISGEKSDFFYRFGGQERALRAGMRGVAFGALLGLDDFRKDAMFCALHAYFLQAKYPAAELSLSIPRLRPIINNAKIHPKDVGERRLLQVLCAYRIFLPFAGITISSRERAGFRDETLALGATKMSAGVSVGIGEHSGEKSGDAQFEITDARSVDEILKMLKSRSFEPVMGDSLYVG